MSITATVIAVISLTLVAWLIVVPWLRIAMRRRASRSVTPKARQLWVQDGDLIYITHADEHGVEIIASLDGGSVQRWKESLSDWQTRCRNRTVWFTGREQPL